ncbi:hypothetical protein Q1695_003847 [Nippostrongylus brasiliensis]|nr:hypothetical protein Q1695_003847 [Nippostrongylus brasiliensis]
MTYVFLAPRHEPEPEQRTIASKFRNTNKQVVIFAATKFFGMDITTERFLSVCTSTKGFCRITENPADLNIADAVLFHNADYNAALVPKPRKSNRPHVLWSLESPSNDRFRPGPNVINWTMTFRRDANIWYPYGHFRKLKSPVDVDYDEIWDMKNDSKTAVWLASNCFAKNSRTAVVDMLMKQGLHIDRFGRCGSRPPGCDGVNRQGDPCVAELVKPYKFYIALENSNCQDYVTEKFYEALISRMAVPIVLKKEIYVNVGAPKDSFIAISDFKTISDAVKYVNEVADDKEKYLAYHKWRTSYEAIPEHNDDTGFCELCRRLQQTSLKPNSYEDVRDWHSRDQCDDSYAMRYLR